MSPRLTPEDRERVLRRYEEGAPLRQIAREIGRPDITIRRVLEAAGVAFGPPRTSNKRSSPETEAHVTALYNQGLTWQQIIARSGVTSTTVAKILKRNGRDLERKPESAEAKSGAILALYEAGHSTRAIGEMLGHGKSTVNAVVSRHGGEIRHAPECGNPGYFDPVDTPDKAYWLGFISADGCIVTTPGHPEGSHLAVQLAARDREHLAKMKEATGATGSVFCDGESANLSVHSRGLTESLIDLGVTPRKSMTLEPWDGPAGLMPHYWRGEVDGDGSLARKGDGIWTLFLCGSEATVRAFAAWAAEITGTKAKPYRTTCWNISISGRYQVPKLVRALYGNGGVSLDRKQRMADQILADEQPYRKPGPPRMEFASEEERAKYFRAQKAAAQRRYMERKRAADAAT